MQEFLANMLISSADHSQGVFYLRVFPQHVVMPNSRVYRPSLVMLMSPLHPLVCSNHLQVFIAVTLVLAQLEAGQQLKSWAQRFLREIYSKSGCGH